MSIRLCLARVATHGRRSADHMAPPLRLSFLLALVGAFLAVLALGPGAAQSAAAQCRGGDQAAYRMTNRQAAKATLCLLNKKRTARGMSRLHSNRHQLKAARRHSRLMVRKGCFSHECPGEKDLVGRVTSAGYLPCSCSWMVGENIAWGSGRKSTPRNIVDAWMNSAPHRANILNGQFEDIGVAVKNGSPGGSHHKAATYTTDFGFKN